MEKKHKCNETKVSIYSKALHALSIGQLHLGVIQR